MNIGSLLRKHRKAKRLTLRAVAEKASISEGFLSQVENDVKAPSVDTLMRICNVLGVDAGELLTQVSNKEKSIHLRKSDWDDIDMPHTGFATRRFFPPEDRTVIDPSILVIEPGKTIPARKNIKNGQEVLCVLQGSVELVVSGKKYQLEKGDSVHFWSDPDSQRITNTSSQRSFVFWVGTL